MSFSKISAPSLKEIFVREIENSIISGEFTAGSKLPTEKELARTMGVSLTIVKQGLSELESKGFVEIAPRRGCFVADYATKGSMGTLEAIMRYNGGHLSADAIRSFCELRIHMDNLAYELLVERASDEDIKKLGRIVKSVQKANTTEELVGHVIDFFHQSYLLSGNIILPLFYYSTRFPQAEMYERFAAKNGVGKIVEEVEAIYEACEKRDIATIQECVKVSNVLAYKGEFAII